MSHSFSHSDENLVFIKDPSCGFQGGENNGDKARASSSRDISGCFCVTNMNTGVSCIFTIRALSWQLQICQTCFLLTWRIQNNLNKSKEISLKLLRFAHRNIFAQLNNFVIVCYGKKISFNLEHIKDNDKYF